MVVMTLLNKTVDLSQTKTEFSNFFDTNYHNKFKQEKRIFNHSNEMLKFFLLCANLCKIFAKKS